MKRNMSLFKLCIWMIALACAVSAFAEVKRGNSIVAAGSASGTANFKFADPGVTLERFTLLNEGTNVLAVTLATVDEYVATTIYSVTVAGSGSTVGYPARTVVQLGVENIVTGDVVIVRGTISSNAVPYQVRDLRITVTPTSTNTPSPFRWHAIGDPLD